MIPVFFDIDGTLWDRKNNIPDSTREAISLLRRNGHMPFICSGRTRGYITDRRLLSMGFSGIVSGCGTMVEIGGETVFYHRMDNDTAVRAVETVRRYGMRPILEGREYLYMERSEFGNDPYGIKLFSELGERMRSIDGEYGRWEISKLSCATEDTDTVSCFSELSDCLEPIIHNPRVAELVPKGFDKGSGIRKVCELLGSDIGETVAVGDSMNDIGMFRTCGTAVAMGGAPEELTVFSDLVTTPLHEDGIYNAMNKLGLI